VATGLQQTTTTVVAAHRHVATVPAATTTTAVAPHHVAMTTTDVSAIVPHLAVAVDHHRPTTHHHHVATVMTLTPLLHQHAATMSHMPDPTAMIVLPDQEALPEATEADTRSVSVTGRYSYSSLTLGT
jgi:hypothetical protein